ncbi:MAG TPA: hypothetical protein VFM54_24280 [Micromonosporaceae bacterium]|nr:hypothetical protein [Micromonosporaceae bacterium]
MSSGQEQDRVTWRKAGERWCVYGPASKIRAQADVRVTLRSGQTERVYVLYTRDAGQAGGRPMAYGYMADTARRGGRASSPARRRSARPCEDCQLIEDTSDAQGCAIHRGNPQN